LRLFANHWLGSTSPGSPLLPPTHVAPNPCTPKPTATQPTYESGAQRV
jgi:hypothetical protein